MPEPILKVLNTLKRGLLHGLEVWRKFVGSVLLTLVYALAVGTSSAAHRLATLSTRPRPLGWQPAKGYGVAGVERQS